jgi:hypothetical protein
VWSNPVAWKEVRVRGRASCLVRALAGAGLAVGLPAVILALARGRDEAAAANASALCLEVAFFGFGAAALSASAISREREEEKLDLLTVTPLTAGAIWAGKWAGVARGMLPAWVILAAHAAVWAFLISLESVFHADALGFRDLERLAPVWMAVLLQVGSAGAIASMGLFVSLHARKSAVAMAATLVGALAWWIGFPVLFAVLQLERHFEWTMAASPFAVAAGLGAVDRRDWGGGPDLEDLVLPFACTLGFCAAVAGAFTAGFFLNFRRRVRA